MGAALAHGPLPQPQGYHGFADKRPRLGVRNGNDVLTNVAFLAAGAWTLAAVVASRRAPRPPKAWERRGMLVYGGALLLTSIGSTLYHLDPHDATLVGDRVPIAIAFGAFAALVLGERLGARVGARTLGPFVAIGVASVVHWAWTLRSGTGGDLRAYMAVKILFAALPVLAIALAPEPRASRRPLVLVLVLFGVATTFEAFDAEVFRATGGTVSGHTLKHVVAAVSAAALVPWFLARRRVAAAAAGPAR